MAEAATVPGPADPRTLIRIAEEGQLEAVDALIAKGFDLQGRDDGGNTALHLAAYQGSLDVVKYLIGKGAEVDPINDNRDSPLHLAALSNRFEVVKVLLANKADLAKKDDQGYTPLHYAAGEGHADVARHLVVECGGDLHAQNVDGLTPLFCAVQQGHIPVVRTILAHDATTLYGRNRAGDTPLHYAAVAEHGLEMSKLLVEFGADIAAKNDEGDTPLLEALMEKRFEVANLFKSIVNELKASGVDSTNEACRRAAFAKVMATMETDSKNGDATTLSLGSQDSLNYRLQFEEEFKVVAAPPGGFTDIVGSGIPQRRVRPKFAPRTKTTLERLKEEQLQSQAAATASSEAPKKSSSILSPRTRIRFN